MEGKPLVSIVAGAAVFGLGTFASAGPVYTFLNITNNGNPQVGSQLSVEVLDDTDVDVGAGQVGFLFKNAVGTAASVTDVYFDDGTLLGIASIYSNAGVSFSQGASPPNLPSGNNIGFVTTAGFLADSDSPASANGVNASTEWLKIVFNLINSKTYADTVAAIDNGADLRIGLHVQAIGQPGGSDSYVNTLTVVPLPAAAWMGITLLGGTGIVGYLRKRRQADLV